MKERIGAQVVSLVIKKRIVVALVALASSMLTASTQASLVDIQFLDAGSRIQGNEYVGPYGFLVNGVSTMLICDDFVHQINYNQEWTANAYTFNDLSQARWYLNAGVGGTSGLKGYEDMAWLMEEGYANPNSWGDISYAYWAVFNPAQAEGTSGWTSGASNWLARAQSQTFSASEFPNIRIYTPTQTGAGSPQELVGFVGSIPPLPALPLGNVEAVPEGNVFWLLGIGGVVLAGWRWSQKRVAIKAEQ